MDFIHCIISFWNNKALSNRIGEVSEYSNQSSAKHTLCVHFNRYICFIQGSIYLLLSRFNQTYTLCVHIAVKDVVTR